MVVVRLSQIGMQCTKCSVTWLIVVGILDEPQNIAAPGDWEIQECPSTM